MRLIRIINWGARYKLITESFKGFRMFTNTLMLFLDELKINLMRNSPIFYLLENEFSRVLKLSHQQLWHLPQLFQHRVNTPHQLFELF